jgi:hypothetical protein
MNFPFNFRNQAYFYAQGSGGPLGSFSKSMAARSNINIDYTAISGFTITNLSFVLNIQTEPPLVVSQPVIAGQNNILSFVLSAGFGGVDYSISINSGSGNTLRTDTLLVCIEAPYDQHCGCSQCGHEPCDCCDSILDLKEQMATLAPNVNTFGSNFIQYYVSPTPPQNPNLLDKWYNTTNNTVYNYESNGVTNYWQPEFGTGNTVFTGPVTINNSLTVTGAVDLTLDMGTYG